MSVTTIKVFYEKATGPPEIRRFPLNPANGNDCFLHTKEKIQKLYPVLQDEYFFQLFWKDSDGDRIAFSSAEEMKDALNNVTDGVFRVYIPEVKQGAKPKGAATTDKTQSQSKPFQQSQSTSSSSSSSSSSQDQPRGEEPFHPGVICDGCEGSVKGIRYRCCVCPDFDLCSGCEGKGLHTEHDMFKITKPRTNHPFHGFFNPQFADQIHKDAHNAAHAAATAAAASFGCSSSNAGGNNQNNGQKQANYDGYLRGVGANIAAFLDPFGIDVTYDVHHNNGQQQQQQQQQQGRWHCPGGRGQGPFWAGGQGIPSWEGVERRPASSKKQEQSGNAGSGKKDGGLMETDSETYAKEQSGSCDVPMEDNSKEKEVRPGSDEWTFVPDDGSEVQVPNPTTAIPMPAPPAPAIPMPAPPTPATQSPPRDSSDSSVPPSANGIYPDLRLQQSLDQMLAMGFTNSDNWLSELLMENGCDIGLTLDAIKAKATQQLDRLRK